MRNLVVYFACIFHPPGRRTFSLKTDFARMAIGFEFSFKTQLILFYSRWLFEFRRNNSDILSKSSSTRWKEKSHVEIVRHCFTDRALISTQFFLPVSTYFALIQREGASYLSWKREKINGGFDRCLFCSQR